MLCWMEQGCRIALPQLLGAFKGSCGMSLLLEPEELAAAKAVIEAHQAAHYAIVPLAGQIHSHRDKYC